MGVVFLSYHPETRKLAWVDHHGINDRQLGLDL